MGIANKFKSIFIGSWAELFTQIAKVVSIGLAVLIMLAGTNMAKAETLAGQLATPADHRAIALTFAKDGWGTQPNWETIWNQLMTNDVVYHFNSAPTPVVGLDANKAFNADLFKGFPTLQQTITDVAIDGDQVVYRATLEGKNTGEFLGIAPTGKPVKISGVTRLRMTDNKISEWWYDCNLLEVMQQLGVVQD
ncbi:ester cyclase [Leptolyngbya sp. Heron Island J]|uniref:ester cyclase n=1 Tax=Leptolyngbya sp. Heron Island J TaxID=1385935 RepID=UPI0003B952D0|nr:ester cyclase [Leptolyngbya sp. Heron Island J]ESA34626.1 ester cyclase [Leptolyngbya sp. Heron Island J]